MSTTYHGLITGQTRSGKTSLCKYWTRKLPRVLFLDRKEDYEDGTIFEDFSEAVDWWMARRGDPFRLIYRGIGDENVDNAAFSAWLELIEYSQKNEGLPPILVVMEEASLYSSVHDIDPIVKGIFLYGARYGISLLSIVQRDVLTHPVVRDSTYWIAALRNMKVSSDYSRFFDVETLTNLETYNPSIVRHPEQGTHYLVYPPDVDPLAILMGGLTS